MGKYRLVLSLACLPIPPRPQRQRGWLLGLIKRAWLFGQVLFRLDEKNSFIFVISHYMNVKMERGIYPTVKNMTLITDFVTRVEAFAVTSGQSLSTLSRKILNDGKGIARLKEGGQCTLKTLEEAILKLDALEMEHSGEAKLRMTHLDRLEAESIHIMREVAAQCENPVMLYSVGKDSSVMLHLAEKAFYPSKPPFPLMHVDTMWKFKEMIEFRNRRAKEVGMELIVHINPEGKADNVGPFTHGSAVHTDIMKTQGLKQALDKYKFDAAFGGARRDEEKSRAKERIFSFRSENHRWDAKNQRPELWNIYNTRVHKGESMRVFPISNWTELDIWQYIYKENIQIPSLYLSKKRPVVEKDGVLILVDDDRMPIGPDEKIEEKMVRFRTLGCYPLTGAVESEADTLPDVIQEMLLTTSSERQGRVIDSDAGASMEQKKEEGYF